jgi:hypothetical protein
LADPQQFGSGLLDYEKIRLKEDTYRFGGCGQGSLDEAMVAGDRLKPGTPTTLLLARCG